MPALTDQDRKDATPIAWALTLERMKVLSKKLAEAKERNFQLQAQLDATTTSRLRILGRLNKVRDALGD